MAYSHVLLAGLVLLSFATLPIEALRQTASHLERNAVDKATALKLASGAHGPPFPRPCLRPEGEQLTVISYVKGVGPKTDTFTKYCRVALDRSSTSGLDLDTRKKMARLLASQKEFIGSAFTEEETLARVGNAVVNVWLEDETAAIAANVALMNPTPNEACAVGEMGSLSIDPGYQGVGLTKYLTVLTDLALELGFTRFYTKTKVTNRRSLQLQIPRPEFNKFFFTNLLRKVKGMGRKIGYLRWAHDERKGFVEVGTVNVLLMSPTGSGLFPVQSFMTDDQDKICARQVIGYYVAGGDWTEVKNFRKDDLLEQIEIDPTTAGRLEKSSKAGNNQELADLINKGLKLE